MNTNLEFIFEISTSITKCELLKISDLILKIWYFLWYVNFILKMETFGNLWP